MSRTIRRLLLVLLGVAVAASIGYAFLPKPVGVDLAPVTSGPMQVTVDEDGKTRIKERYVVSAPLAGRVLRIDMDPGDDVVGGISLLATIEPNDPELLDARAVAESEARVKAADATFQRAGPSLEQARVALEHAETELARARKLAKSKAISQEEVDDAVLQYRLRSEEFRAASFAQEIAGYELEQAKSALLRTKPSSDNPENKWQFEIRAPISGRVLRVFQESAAVVSAGTSLLEIGDPQDLEVEIDVLSSDAVKIIPGAKVSIEHWGGDQPLEGTVRLVEPSAFTKVSALGVEEQRVNVIADFVDPPEQRQTLGHGFRVEGRIVIWASQRDVLKVPGSALFREGQDWAVFAVAGGRAQLRTVQLGQRNSREAEVLQGLAPDDQVIVHPSDRVRAGVAVVSRETNREQ